jgi:selenide,water dikinase
MQARCRSTWYSRLVDTLLASNQLAASLADEFDMQAMTDITGFGLAGHLLEMLAASGLGAELELARVPLLPGVAELVAEGVQSTLAPANRSSEASIRATVEQQAAPQYAALFDPQTSGGLLLGVPEKYLSALQERLAAAGLEPAQVGRALARGSEPCIHLR